MSLETLGGRMPPGRPAAVFAGGKTHVFAIAAGGAMNHWSSPNGLDWTGPDALPAGPTNLEPSYPCAIAFQNGVHVFAINHGDGSLVQFHSLDGASFSPPVWAGGGIPGGANGVAASAASAATSGLIDTFAATPGGIVQDRWRVIGGLASTGTLPASGGLPRGVPAAVSAGPNVTDVFAFDQNGDALRWHSTNGTNWTKSVLPRPSGAAAGAFVRSGFAAVSPAPGQVELFAATSDGRLTNWSLGPSGNGVKQLSTPVTLHESVPAAVVTDDGHIELFAILQPPNPLSGGNLVRWRWKAGTWIDSVVVDANLAAGGLGAAAAQLRVDAFGINSGTNNSLLHWPAGIGGANTNEPWANWANNQSVRPAGHLHPKTPEEVVAIVKTAERDPRARVRAVGSSWSFPDIAMTPWYIVETNGLRGVITDVIDGSVLTEHAPDPKYLVHVEAGIQVESLMAVLDSKGLAPFTMGGSSGQTLGGVISTGVHGSDWDRGPIVHAVRAIELVGPGGVQHWIEPDEWRITNEAPLRARLGPDVQIHYDDDRFDSVLVSIGSMGIITSVVVEATDQVLLARSIETLPWSDLRPRLASGSDLKGETRYVSAVIDPAQMGNRTCYLITHRPSSGPRRPGTGTDPLGLWCHPNIGEALAYLVASPAADAVTAAVTTAVAATYNAIAPPFGLPPLPPGIPLSLMVGPLAGFLQIAGPGAAGDFLGQVFNHSSEAAAWFASWLTADTLKPGKDVSVDFAHTTMAPPDPGECGKRGLGLELAFDTFRGEHLTFVDDAMALLDQKRSQGMVLGGWFSLRFVGPSRAILSPQRSARTCMIEFVGLRSLNSTEPLLNALEQLGTDDKHGGIQHWGMFSVPNLSKSDVTSAYPRLDTWRRVRRELSNGGTIHTFENAFSARVGLDDPPAGAPLVRQQDWRWCSKCMGMAFGGRAPGPCPAGGTHDHGGSGNYGFAHNTPSAPGQRDWRWCSKCMGMTFAGAPWSTCPAGGVHDLGHSGEYTIVRNGQSNRRLCKKCQCLCSSPGQCPAGARHDLSGSGDYWLAVSSPEVAGESGWMACKRCGTLARKGGKCVGGQQHSLEAKVVYTLPLNAPTSPGQAHWRICQKCQSLAFRGGRCFAAAKKGGHVLAGSGDYTVRLNAGQAEWRRCENCHGLWFSGGGGQGVCPVQPAMISVPSGPGGATPGPAPGRPPSRGVPIAPGGAPLQGHVPAPDEFFVPFQ
jgi:hypothetical protein